MKLFHRHNWEVVQKYLVTRKEYSPWGMYEVGKRYVVVERCTKCGKIRRQFVNI